MLFLYGTGHILSIYLPVEKWHFLLVKYNKMCYYVKCECISMGTRCTFLALRNNKKGEFLYYGRKNNYGTAAPEHGGRGDH